MASDLARRLVLSLALLLTLGAGCASAQVTFDANATADCAANGVAGATGKTCATLTVGSGTNRALVCAFAFSSTSIGTPTVVWDSGGTNQAMTQIVAANSTQPTRSVLFGLVAPTSGAKTLKATWTGTSDVMINCTSFAGVDQTGSTTTFPNSGSATGSSTTGALTITSAVNDYTISTASQDASVMNAPNQTQTFLDNSGTGISAAGTRAAGAATVAHSYPIQVSSPWVVVGTSIKAAGGGATRGLFQVPSLSGLGIGGSFFRDPLQFVGLAGWAFAVLVACAVATHQTLKAVDQVQAHLTTQREARVQATALDAHLKAQMEIQQSEAKQRELLKVRRG